MPVSETVQLEPEVNGEAVTLHHIMKAMATG